MKNKRKVPLVLSYLMMFHKSFFYIQAKLLENKPQSREYG